MARAVRSKGTVLEAISNQEKFNNAFERIPTPLTLIGDSAMKGVAAALSLDSNTHIIITAPNWESLRRAWAVISTCKLDETKAHIVCEALIGKFDYSAIEPSPPPVSHRIDVKTLYWYYHPESDCVFLEHEAFGSYDGMAIRIGDTKAEAFTVIAAKVALRNAGWSRGDIEAVQISVTFPDEDIPF